MTPYQSILLVDDSDDDYEATVRSLKKNNVMNPVHWCKNGQDALNYLRNIGVHPPSATERLPSLILLDLNMPGIDGREVLSSIKADERLRGIPIVILTTSSDERDVNECYRIGASTYIQKPVTFEGLTDAIGALRHYWFDIAILPGHSR